MKRYKGCVYVTFNAESLSTAQKVLDLMRLDLATAYKKTDIEAQASTPKEVKK